MTGQNEDLGICCFCTTTCADQRRIGRRQSKHCTFFNLKLTPLRYILENIALYLKILFQKRRRKRPQSIRSSAEVGENESKPSESLPPMAAALDMIDNRVPVTGEFT